VASWFYRTLDTLLDKTVLFSYIRTGYVLRRRMWDPADLDVDMTGKTCIVTGANSGLGLATTERLADLGASGCIDQQCWRFAIPTAVFS